MSTRGIRNGRAPGNGPTVRTVTCVGIAGNIDLPPRDRKRFAALQSLTSLTSMDQALAHPGFWLARTSARAATAVSSL